MIVYAVSLACVRSLSTGEGGENVYLLVEVIELAS